MPQEKPPTDPGPDPEENLDGKISEEASESPVESAPRIERYPEPPPDFELDVPEDDVTPASELGEFITGPVEPDVPEEEETEDGSGSLTESDLDVTDEVPASDIAVSEGDTAEKPVPKPPVPRIDTDREGRVLPPPDKRKRSGDFKLLSVQPFIKDEEIMPVPGDQRRLPMKIFCARGVYRNMAAHAQKGVDTSPEGAMEVKGALIGAVLMDTYPILFIADTLEFPASPDDRNDQCSFGAVEDELIRRKLASLPAGLSVVGYYHSHPDHPVFFSDFDVAMHNRRCNTPWKIGIVVQPRERKIGFFLKQPVNGEVLKAFVHAQKPDIVIAYDENGVPAGAVKEPQSSRDAEPVPPPVGSGEKSTTADVETAPRDIKQAPVQKHRKSLASVERSVSSKSKWMSVWVVVIAVLFCTGLAIWMWRSGKTHMAARSSESPPAGSGKQAVTTMSADGKKIITLVEKTPTPASAAQEERKAVLVFTVNVRDAVVVVDKKPLPHGTTSLELSPGMHKIQVMAKGYRTIEETIDFTAGETVTKFFRLEKPVSRAAKKAAKTGRLTLTFEQPDVSCFWDGDSVTLNGKKHIIRRIAPGTHYLEVKKDGYIDFTKSIEIPDKNGVWSVSVYVHMDPVPPTATPVPLVDLRVTSSPKGAHVIFDHSRIDGKTPLVIPGVKPGIHSISVEKKGYFAKNLDRYQVPEGTKSATINFVLNPLPTPTPDRSVPRIVWVHPPETVHRRNTPLKGAFRVEARDISHLKVRLIYRAGKNLKKQNLKFEEKIATEWGGVSGLVPFSLTTRSIDGPFLVLHIEIIDRSRDVVVSTSKELTVELVGQ